MEKASFETKNLTLTEDKWVWVDGFKGTDRDMCCRGYQFELGKQHDMPEDAEIKECESGFHLCRELKHVFDFYSIGNGNRFFKVKALVRQTDLVNYGKCTDTSLYVIPVIPMSNNKLVAKSIVFQHELTNDEVLCGTDANDWTSREKELVMKEGFSYVKRLRDVEKLKSVGYSGELSNYIVSKLDNDAFNKAYVLGTQEGLSMDVKISIIFNTSSVRTTVPYIPSLYVTSAAGR